MKMRLLSIFALALMIGPARFAVAQVSVIHCSSDDGGRHVCPAETRGGVQLTRQISGSACVQGSTWGYDARGLWVDRGCRAEFTDAAATEIDPLARDAALPLSDDGGRHVCPANTRGGVQLNRQ